CGDESTLLQLPDVLADSVFTHAHCFSDGSDAGPALVGPVVFTPTQKAVHRQFTGVQSKLENLIGQREKITPATVLAVPHTPPPVCSFTHWMNCSFGTTILLPTRSIGKSGS